MEKRTIILRNGTEKEFAVNQEDAGGLFSSEKIWRAYEKGFLGNSYSVGEHKDIDELAKLLKERYGGDSYEIKG